VIETRGERLVFSALPNAVPSPRTIVAPVFNDVMTRTLIVGRPEGGEQLRQIVVAGVASGVGAGCRFGLAGA
jgi:hypothetical protein